MCKPFWSTGLCTPFRAAGASVNLPHRCESQHIPSCISRRTCCALPTCAHGLARPTRERESKVQWVSFLGGGPSFVSLGFLVTFACRSGLNNRGGVSGFTRWAGNPPNNFLPTTRNNYRRAHTNTTHKQIRRRARTKKKVQKQFRDARAQTYKYEHWTEQCKTTTHIQLNT